MNAFCMHFETLCGHKFEKNVQKTEFFFFFTIFTLVNAYKACAKTVSKCKQFVCVLRHFVEKILKKKKREKTVVFPRYFHFGKCVQNTGNIRLEINAFCMCFETLCEDRFEK